MTSWYNGFNNITLAIKKLKRKLYNNPTIFELDYTQVILSLSSNNNKLDGQKTGLLIFNYLSYSNT